MTLKDRLADLKGCFRWVDARSFHAVNRVSSKRLTELMLLVPLGERYGIGLIRLTKPEEPYKRTVLEENADTEEL